MEKNNGGCLPVLWRGKARASYSYQKSTEQGRWKS